MSRAASANLRKLSRSLFSDAEDQQRLIHALTNPADEPVAVVWRDARPSPFPFTTLPRPVWFPDAVDLVPFSERPGRHPLHEAGACYCLDAGSVFESQVLSVCRDQRIDTVIDVCASPGGKSILAWRLLQPQRLLCNEVVAKRLPQLRSNLRRCRIDNAELLSVAVEQLAERQGASADLVIVDAPCSGQSLLARGKPSPGCFHPATINLNLNRQRRILAHAIRLVRSGGFLAYMTCTYSLKENERNVEWLLKHTPGLEALPVPVLEDYRSGYSEIPCYRSWPFDGPGSGGFTSLFRCVSS